MIEDRKQPAFIAQELKLLALDDAGTTDHVMSLAFRLVGEVEVERLAEACSGVLRRDSLRSRFVRMGDTVEQIFPSSVNAADYVFTLEARDDDHVLTWMDEVMLRPFGLWDAALCRFGIARTGADEVVWVFTCSHTVSDGWSMDLILDDLARLYQREGLDPAPEFADWAVRRTRELTESREEERTFWRSAFPGRVTGAPLPAPLPERLVNGHPGPLYWTLGAVETDRLKQAAGSTGSSLYLYLLAAVHLLRRAEMAGDDLTYTVNITARDDDDAEGTVGCLTHRALLRISSSPDANFDEVVELARDALLDTLSHATVPFPLLRSWLREWHGEDLPEGHFTYVVLGREWGSRLEIPGLEISAFPEPLEPDPGSLGLEFWFTELNTGELHLRLRYPPANYRRDTVQKLVDGLARCLVSAIAPSANMTGNV